MILSAHNERRWIELQLSNVSDSGGYQFDDLAEVMLAIEDSSVDMVAVFGKEVPTIWCD